MFEIVKKRFSQDLPFWFEASANCFSNDFELDFGGVWAARSAHILLFGRPGNACMFFGSQLPSFIFRMKSD